MATKSQKAHHFVICINNDYSASLEIRKFFYTNLMMTVLLHSWIAVIAKIIPFFIGSATQKK